MSAMQNLLTQTWVQHLGWTLVQFLWQGTLIALLFATLRVLFRGRMTAHGRYNLACSALGLMVAAPVLTFLLRLSVPIAPAWPVPAPDTWRSVLPWLVAAWLGGVVLCSTRVIAGWRLTARLRSVGVRPAHGEWQRKLADLMGRLGVSRPVRLLVSSLVDVPVVIGWWTPVILMPVGMLAGLPPALVEALLAHELAHIRRLDYLINVLQGLAEAALFYHPAVWWVSDQIRQERELCCDDLAVAASGDVLVYAHALAELESHRPAHTHALAASGGALLDRIKRLLGHAPPLAHVLPAPGIAGAMCALWIVGIGAVATQAAPPRDLPSPFATQQSSVEEGTARASHPILSTLFFGPVGPAPIGRATTQQPQPALSQAQAAPKATGSLAGVISAADSGAPIKRAHVAIASAEPNSTRSVMTDDEGRYVFTELPAGRYTVTASKTGYFEAIYGQKAPQHAGTLVPLAEGQKLERINIPLPKGGVIAGVLRDENGDLSPDTVVQAMRYDMSTGEKQLVLQSSTQTDDRGVYRLHNLPHGTYLVMAVPKLDTGNSSSNAGRAGGGGRGAPQPPSPPTPPVGQDRTDYVPVYFPGTTRASDATPVSVGLGDEKPGIDFGLQLLPMAKLEGTILGLGDGSLDYYVGQPRSTTTPQTNIDGRSFVSLQNFSMQLVDADAQTGLPRATGGSAVFGDHFTFASVPPGHYVIQVRSAKPGVNGAPPIGLWGDLELNVDGHNQDNLVITLQEGITVTGHLTVDSAATGTAANLALMRVSLARQGAGQAAGVIPHGVADASGRFVLNGVTPGSYILTVAGPGGWTAKSVIVGGKDALDFGLHVRGSETVDELEVVVTNKSTQVSGTLLDATGKPTADYTVIVFAAESKYWLPQARRIQATRPGTDGKFTIRGLPAGDYLIAAMTDIETGQWYDPTLLEQLKGTGTTIHLADGDQKTQDLRIAKSGERPRYLGNSSGESIRIRRTTPSGSLTSPPPAVAEIEPPRLTITSVNGARPKLPSPPTTFAVEARRVSSARRGSSTFTTDARNFIVFSPSTSSSNDNVN